MPFQLNINPIVTIDLTVGTLILISLLITIIAPKTKKVFHIRFIQLGILGITLSYYLEAISILYLSEIFVKITGLILFPITVFFVIGVNYIVREKPNTLALVITCCLGVILCVNAYLPDAVIIEFEDKFLMINLDGWFKVIADTFQVIIVGIIGYWGIITWSNAPFLIKKEANIFLIGTSCIVIRVLINLLVNIHPLWILGVHVVFALGIIILTLVITNEPKILFIFPFTLYRIIVRDKEGYPLFDHDWSQSKISEKVFTGFLNAIQLMSTEVINLGGLLDIDLKEGNLMIHESHYISVGLVSSKTSKFLRNTLSNFTEDFEKLFEKKLVKEIKEPKEYEAAYLLIDKYFANFPIRLIKAKKDDILLESNYLEIPKQLEQKLESITINEEELNLLKSELHKAPTGFTSEFFKLYDKLTREDAEELDKAN